MILSKWFKIGSCVLVTAFSTSLYASETTIYQCDDGERFEVAYPNQESAILNYRGQLFLLKSAISASGARYTGEGLQWWTKGEEGSLSPLLKGEDYAKAVGKTCNPLKLATTINNK